MRLWLSHADTQSTQPTTIRAEETQLNQFNDVLLTWEKEVTEKWEFARSRSFCQVGIYAQNLNVGRICRYFFSIQNDGYIIIGDAWNE